MMKEKKLSKNKIYLFLQGKRQKIKFRSLFLALFVLGVNIYAWFVYFTEAQVNITGNVVSWDVNFRDENQQVIEKVILADIKMYPGMDEYKKEINITNSSELPAKFTYELEEVTLLGKSIMDSDSDINESLVKSYPFKIQFSSNGDAIDIGSTMKFSFSVFWPFEAEGEDDRYYLLNKYYSFDPSVSYYNYSNNNYEVFLATSENFLDNVNNLYLEKDDADSFWGEKCGKWEKDSGEACLKVKLKLRVSQA